MMTEQPAYQCNKCFLLGDYEGNRVNPRDVELGPGYSVHRRLWSFAQQRWCDHT